MLVITSPLAGEVPDHRDDLDCENFTLDDDDVKHLLWLSEKLGEDLVDMAVVHTGATAYRRRDGVAVIPAALLGP